MKPTMPAVISMIASLLIAASVGAGAHASEASASPYRIVDLGVLPGDGASQGSGVSPRGTAVGRSLGSTNTAYAWTRDSGMVALPKLPTFDGAVAEGVNDRGVVVGTASRGIFGFDPQPVAWTQGAIHRLRMPPGASGGRAHDVNAQGVIVGLTFVSGSQRAFIRPPRGDAAIITATTRHGDNLSEALAINDDRLVVGVGVDPTNAARNVSFVVDARRGKARDIGALPGQNGGIAFGVSNAGHVVGSSQLFQGSGLPYVWTAAAGMVAIPLPLGASEGSARAVNSDGIVVGNAGGVFAVPFLYDGQRTVRLQDLIPSDSAWDLSRNTSSGADAITDRGVIAGTGVIDGEIHAFLMVPRSID